MSGADVSAVPDVGVEERIGPGSPWWGEHTSRYELAKPLVAGKTVLDAACGTGYGSAALQATAKWVVGVDLDPVAIEAARRAIDPKKGEILRADATKLPFEDGHFGAITSFETLEHLPDRPAFLRELARVLAKDGVLVLSTPNARYTRPIDGKPRNRFHLFEYQPHELREELGRVFPSVELMGQTLDSKYVVPPFEFDMETVTDPGIRLGYQVRRVAGKLPSRAREAVSHLLWGHDFFPATGDYRFSPETVADAPVLVAFCRHSPASP